jgi:hypothetical protein
MADQADITHQWDEIDTFIQGLAQPAVTRPANLESNAISPDKLNALAYNLRITNDRLDKMETVVTDIRTMLEKLVIDQSKLTMMFQFTLNESQSAQIRRSMSTWNKELSATVERHDYVDCIVIFCSSLVVHLLEYIGWFTFNSQVDETITGTYVALKTKLTKVVRMIKDKNSSMADYSNRHPQR